MASNSSFPGSPTSAFPTFLDHDPYPSASRDGRPMSSGSFMTDATSDFGGGEEYTTPQEGYSNVPSMTGAVGESGLPPSRPTSMASEATPRPANRTSLPPPSSRRGPPTVGTASRPNTGTSKTHVPSLAAQGFFRPLSSQQLQAQRGQRPTTGNTVGQDAAGSKKLPDEPTQSPRRYSNASVNTLRDAQPNKQEDVPPLPVSRGTQFTGGEEANNAGGSVTSETPLQKQQRLTGLDTAGVRSANGGSSPAPPKSPRSFRASLGLNSRASKQDADRRPSPSQQHEKLNSNPSSPNLAEKEKPHPISSPTKQPKPKTGKNYEYFAGNTLFFLSGRCLNTKAKPLNVATFIISTLPCALFGAFSGPWLWRHVSPAIPIVFAYIFYITMSAYLHAALSDPGILPRNLHPHPPNPEEERDLLTPGPATTEWITVKTFESSGRAPLPNRNNDSSAENGNAGATAMEVPTKYCKSCNIWRPPRAHHCRVCDSCMETQDHHCVWLGNCVGRRNYRYFFTYVSFGSVLALMLIAFTLTHVILYAQRHHISFLHSITGRTEERIAFATFLFAALALPYPGSLFIYHLWLVARGETTREYLNSHKFLKKDRHRPFTQASELRNWITVLLRPHPPTYLQFKRRHNVGDVRYGYMQTRSHRKKGLKNRYSVQNGNGNGNGNGRGEMEMKSIPYLSSGPKPQARSDVGGGAGLNGVGVNGTPR